jgi:hypothetical protein
VACRGRAQDPTSLAAASEGGDDVGLIKVVAFEKERLASLLGERIGEAVAEIQPGWMAAFAEVVKGLAREMRLLDSHGLNPDANPAKQRVALLKDFNGELALEDNGELDEVARGYSAPRGVADGLDIQLGIRLSRKDGDERRRIQDHLGSPRSS